jgi:3'-phosphoadenosine 5'-phosphosulfate (PAPS) 3'-phosphatase
MNAEIERASELARAAGALVIAIRDKGLEALGVEAKPGDEPVTVADRAANELIVSVYQPTRDRLYWTTGGRSGSWLTEGGEARRLEVSAVSDAGAIRMVASRSNRGPALDKVKSALNITDELAIGSVGLKLGLIAAGERDLYVNPWPKCKAWDTCAPEAILVAAGGVLTDTKGGPIRYDEEDLARRGGLVASNGLIHAGVLERLANLMPA